MPGSASGPLRSNQNRAVASLQTTDDFSAFRGLIDILNLRSTNSSPNCGNLQIGSCGVIGQRKVRIIACEFAKDTMPISDGSPLADKGPTCNQGAAASWHGPICCPCSSKGQFCASNRALEVCTANTDLYIRAIARFDVLCELCVYTGTIAAFCCLNTAINADLAFFSQSRHTENLALIPRAPSDCL